MNYVVLIIWTIFSLSVLIKKSNKRYANPSAIWSFVPESSFSTLNAEMFHATNINCLPFFAQIPDRQSLSLSLLLLFFSLPFPRSSTSCSSSSSSSRRSSSPSIFSISRFAFRQKIIRGAHLLRIHGTLLLRISFTFTPLISDQRF